MPSSSNDYTSSTETSCSLASRGGDHDNKATPTTSFVLPSPWSAHERDEAATPWGQEIGLESRRQSLISSATQGYFPGCEYDISFPSPVAFSGLTGEVVREPDRRRGRGGGRGPWDGGGKRASSLGVEISREVRVEVDPPVVIVYSGEEEGSEGEKGDPARKGIWTPIW